MDSEQLVFSIISEALPIAKQHRQIKNFTKAVNQNLKKLALANGLPGEISSYWARHSFATNALRNGASIEFVSEALNHSDPRITQNYFAGFEEPQKKEFMNRLMTFE